MNANKYYFGILQNMKCYKVTNKRGYTKLQTKWGNGVSHTAKGDGDRLCSNGFIHFYRDPRLAVLMHCQYTSHLEDPILWEAQSSGNQIHRFFKSGAKKLTTIKRIPFPKITKNQRIAIAILCVKTLIGDCDFRFTQWADKWLSGEDRTKKTARLMELNFTIGDIEYNVINAVTYYSYASSVSRVLGMFGVRVPFFKFKNLQKIIDEGMKIK